MLLLFLAGKALNKLMTLCVLPGCRQHPMLPQALASLKASITDNHLGVLVSLAEVITTAETADAMLASLGSVLSYVMYNKLEGECTEGCTYRYRNRTLKGVLLQLRRQV